MLTTIQRLLYRMGCDAMAMQTGARYNVSSRAVEILTGWRRRLPETWYEFCLYADGPILAQVVPPASTPVVPPKPVGTIRWQDAVNWLQQAHALPIASRLTGNDANQTLKRWLANPINQIIRPYLLDGPLAVNFESLTKRLAHVWTLPPESLTTVEVGRGTPITWVHRQQDGQPVLWVYTPDDDLLAPVRVVTFSDYRQWCGRTAPTAPPTDDRLLTKQAWGTY